MSDEGKVIKWTQPKLAAMAEAHKEATARKQDTFMFEGDQYDRRYAGYLIQYLAQEFNEARK